METMMMGGEEDMIGSNGWRPLHTETLTNLSAGIVIPQQELTQVEVILSEGAPGALWLLLSIS
jgi:hypothetical protein